MNTKSDEGRFYSKRPTALDKPCFFPFDLISFVDWSTSFFLFLLLTSKIPYLLLCLNISHTCVCTYIYCR